ncbi:uncharacterized protein EI90DRAFT_3138010 [Cantharellus anzutake]|uniref:uncharacterized protein n=1 Tax=Cantharellus anzutake TaxID=1750568 RepID=UPI001904FC0D|nr:uncharacterized protein EI90DRAFT_3138010 [Cantharellus anzutake]KAF8311787.1 hypothetical protein EI90DRAFT_3138010 [Cantharellus anzutake]
MSSNDLDADLYKDLYGVDESDEQEVKTNDATPADKVPSAVGAAALEPASGTTPMPSIGNTPPPALPSTIKPPSQSTVSTNVAPVPPPEGTSSIPVFTDEISGSSSRNQSSQVAQQFASYDQPADQDHDGYAGGSSEGRSIRPSEMRDEG